MFTLNQISEAYQKVKTGSDFPKLVQDLIALGVISYSNRVEDGQTIYSGVNQFQLVSPAKYPLIKINHDASTDRLKQALLIHQKGETDYFTFCQHAAEAGVDQWITDMQKMTVSYLDQNGTILLQESIPNFKN